jgi:hypothetical protein
MSYADLAYCHLLDNRGAPPAAYVIRLPEPGHVVDVKGSGVTWLSRARRWSSLHIALRRTV